METTIDNLDSGSQYEVQVLARNDEGDSPWSPSGRGSTNAEDNARPSFSGPFVRRLNENTRPGQNFDQPVTAEDDDLSDESKDERLSYTLVDRNAELFDIDRSTGQLRTASGATYDYEAQSTYTITVKVEDRKGASDTTDVTIEIVDLDEPPNAPPRPTVTTGPSPNQTERLSVTWNPPRDNSGRPPIAGYDLRYSLCPDGECPAESDATWVDGPQDQTGLQATIGSLTANALYQVQVRAQNRFVPENRNSEGPWSPSGTGRTADDMGPNNSPPNFMETSVIFSFDENTPGGQDVGEPLTVEDVDDESLTITLEGADPRSFVIQSTKTGNHSWEVQIKTKSGVRYDYETRPTYAVIVKAVDDDGASDAVAVTINLIDVPEGDGGPSGDRRPPRHPADSEVTTRDETTGDETTGDDKGPSPADFRPTFPGDSATRSFAENTPPGRNVGARVTAIIASGDPLTYTLGGTDAASFDIDSSTGQIRTKAGVTYDYEVKSSYAVTVTATTGPTKDSASIPVTVNVTDVDEKPATPDAPTVSAPGGSTTTLLATWTAPDLNGGPPLTGYDVQYRQGTSGAWTDWPHTGTATTTTITQLAGGTDYQVRVRALGEAPSDWSPPGSGRTGSVAVNDWVERFGRSIAQQLMEGVGERLAFPCRTGLQGTLAGHGFGGDGRGSAGMLAGRWLGDDPTETRLHETRIRTEHDPGFAAEPALLAGSDFELAGETTGGGIACVWGRGAYASFNVREGQFTLDGSVTTGTLGADYQMGPWTVGLALSHSRGEGRYGSSDDIDAALTGLFPYAGYQVTERLSAWGLGGFGRGGLTVTPQNGAAMEADMGLLMIGAGLRSLLLSAAHGMNVAFETDGFWVHAASDGTSGLRAANADANRLRFGLESSYRVALQYGGTLTPRFEIGWRYDGGGAETGLGMDIGGGLVWWAPAGGITAEIEVRRMLMHEATGFNDWSVSGLVRYDPKPFSERGASVAFRSSVGPPSLDGASALLERDSMEGLASSNASHGGQLTAEAAYGFPILGGRFTGAPWAGVGMLGSGRDYRVGYRISPGRQFGSHMQIGIEGVRRENDDAGAETEHAIGLQLGMRW